jgi:hypothetical protein
MALNVALVLGALVAAVVLHAALQWRRLSHIPGPFWAAFSKYWMVSEAWKRRQPTALKELNNKYGMFAPSHTVLSNYLTVDCRIACAHRPQ